MLHRRKKGGSDGLGFPTELRVWWSQPPGPPFCPECLATGFSPHVLPVCPPSLSNLRAAAVQGALRVEVGDGATPHVDRDEGPVHLQVDGD